MTMVYCSVVDVFNKFFFKKYNSTAAVVVVSLDLVAHSLTRTLCDLLYQWDMFCDHGILFR